MLEDKWFYYFIRRTINFVTLVNLFCIKGNKDNDNNNGSDVSFRALKREK